MLLTKKNSSLLMALTLAFTASSTFAAPTAAPLADDVLKYPSELVLDFGSGNYTGQSLLYTQKTLVKPILDRFARDGFVVASGDDVVKALNVVAPKVRAAILAKQTTEQLKTIANALRAQGPISFLTMPTKIAAIDRRADRFNLPTFFALVSAGGAALRFAKGDYAYNVNYAIGAPPRGASVPPPGYDPKAIQTGRSFGMGIGQRDGESGTGPNDVSDQTHLKGLQNLVQASPKEGLEMSRTIVQATGNMDFSNFANQSPLAQTLTSDYFAVYTAEQIRNLMDTSLTTQSWDVSLMEVTLLSAYYANLREIWVMYQDTFHEIPMTYTNEVYNQYSARIDTLANGEKNVTWKLRKAGFSDYWQRSTQFKPDQKDLRESRSGINITRPQFRLMGSLITKWMVANKPQVVKAVTTILRSNGTNVYAELSGYFINARATTALPQTGALAEAFVDFQKAVEENAPAIQESIKAQYPKVPLTAEKVSNSKQLQLRFMAASH